MADTSPQKAPETAPAKPSAASEVKITLDTTKGKLVDLRQRLGVEGVADPKKEKEIKEIEKRFEADKDKILTISQKSLDALKSDVHDANETIDGKFDVKPDGELVFEGKAESIPATPETPKALEVSLTAITGIKIPENVQEEMAKFSPKSGNFMQMILDKILDFFAGFAPDWVAKMR